MLGGPLKVEVRKAILLFLVLFLTWQILYLVTLIFPSLDWLLAYSVVLAVATCFFVLGKQNAGDLGLKKTQHWVKYVIIGFVFAVFYNLYWAVLGVPIFSTGPKQVVQHGIFTIPYNALFALVVGVVEETSFMGYILRNLSKAYSSTKAIAYSSILFGLYHLSLVSAFSSTMSVFETFTYWALFVLAAVLIGLFLGYFYVSTQKTTIGTITYHSFSIFLESLVPLSLATSQLNGHLFSTTVYIIFIPILILLKRKGWLSDTSR
jgi:membrane protease YdiL (CAAX protease family)